VDFTANKVDLSRVLSRAASVVPSKPDRAIIGMVRIDVADGRVSARATDNFIGVSSSTTCSAKASGSIAIDARRAAEIVKSMPAGDVRVREFKGKIEISAGKSKFNVPCLDPEDCPPMPQPSASSRRARVEANELARVLTQGTYAMSADVSRPHMCGTLLEPRENDTLRVVSTDGLRMTYAETKREGELARMFLPDAGVHKLLALCESSKDATVEVASSGAMSFFTAGDVTLYVQLGDDKFPPYEKMLAASPSKHTVTIGTDALIEAIKRIDIMAKIEGDILLTFSEGQLSLSSEHDGAGDGEVIVDCDSTCSVKIAVHSKYLGASVAKLRDESAVVRLAGSRDPLHVSSERNECAALVMPMLLKSNQQ
jgi:DNA polymerase-3 subunit beta